jgi:Protein of unknown function DUF262
MFRVSQFDPKTLRWWFSQCKKIDMNPSYQRHGRLWSKSDKAFLIDSIINEFDVPKIYVADFTFGASKLNSKKMAYAIIDGKQRFEAMFDFFEGRLTLDKDFEYLGDPKLRLGGLGYPDLRKNYPDVADIFDNFSLSVMRVITDDKEKINELFVRLNRSKPLTGAEIRNAMAGPVPELTRLVADHELFKSFIRFPITRGQDKNAAAKLLLFEHSQKPVESKRKNLDAFTKIAARGNRDEFELASRRVLDNLDRMSEIFLPRDPLLGSAGVLPVYFWFIRGCPSSDDTVLREFLIDFERQRKANREIDSKSIRSHRPEKDLGEYDLLNRSTNDEKSHVRRIEILTQRFGRFPL